ncbi:MAG: methyltransferase domain-containing protein [Planctomycetaceae bacterium]|nr:methyltransferase domain-containing protein [Planctomycetaceae bacterium]
MRKPNRSVAQISPCPACGHQLAVAFLEPFRQPLATIAWPSSEEQAKAMQQLPHSFVRCTDCGHVYNRDFCYENVPYDEKPNLMFNRGAIWTNHLIQTADLLSGYLPEGGTAIEIGCGEGHLLRHMAAKRRGCRFLGFDPSGAFLTEGLFQGRNELFLPETHMEQYQPDLLICRHVIEHLLNPLGFLQAIQFYASRFNLRTRIYIETPCVDRAIENGRVVDFYYEHYSHFTTSSFTKMIQRTTHEIELLTHNYNREVISGIFRVGSQHPWLEIDNQAADFRTQAQVSADVLAIQLEQMLAQRKRIAIWGGTGKAAVFINRYRMDAKRFPIVVDSDAAKVNTFVPGQGQRILFRDHLLKNPVDIIIIPMAWRAQDVLLEIQETGIRCDQILLEHQGTLVDFHRDHHPYATADQAPRLSIPAPHYNPQRAAYWSEASQIAGHS